jgi:hypothetical protein
MGPFNDPLVPRTKEEIRCFKPLPPLAGRLLVLPPHGRTKSALTFSSSDGAAGTTRATSYPFDD